MIFIVNPLVDITSDNAIMPKKKSQDNPKTADKQGFPMKEVRESLNMSQEQFAVALGVSTSKISTAERGLSEPVFTIKQVKKLCELAKKTLDEMPDYLGKDYQTEE
ncbi:MAG: helix-turn-helix transcriptional regulator [Cyanobacteria bacterium J06623_7]